MTQQNNTTNWVIQDSNGKRKFSVACYVVCGEWAEIFSSGGAPHVLGGAFWDARGVSRGTDGEVGPRVLFQGDLDLAVGHVDKV